MSPDPEAVIPTAMPPDEFRALVEKLRAAQRRPSVRRTFYSTVDKDALLSLEGAIDRELARRAGGEGAT